MTKEIRLRGMRLLSPCHQEMETLEFRQKMANCHLPAFIPLCLRVFSDNSYYPSSAMLEISKFLISICQSMTVEVHEKPLSSFSPWQGKIR
jgi:hypothetical protein